MSDWQDAEEHVERAHEHFEAHRWEEAASELRRALALDPYRAEWHYNLGLTLEAAGRVSDAADAFSSANRLEPGNRQTLVALGAMRLRLDRVREAVEALDEAHSIDPAWPEPLVHLIEAHARLGDLEQAELSYYLAIQSPDADEALANLNMGVALLDAGDAPRATACLEQAADRDPDLPGVHARLAEAAATDGRRDVARRLYLKELRRRPGDVDTILDLAHLLLEMGRLPDAGEKLRRALELDPKHPDAHFQLAELALRMRRFSEAALQYRITLRLDPGHPVARRRLAQALLELDEREPASRALRGEMRRLRESPETFGVSDLLELGDLLLATNSAPRAVIVYERAAQADPEDPEAWRRLSVARFEKGERDAGVDAARKAIRLGDTRIETLFNLALAAYESRRDVAALAWLRRALLLEPDDAPCRRLLTRVRLRLAFRALRRLRRRDATSS
jgi:tetratricopeptide (TPR) repeat protein